MSKATTAATTAAPAGTTATGATKKKEVQVQTLAQMVDSTFKDAQAEARKLDLKVAADKDAITFDNCCWLSFALHHALVAVVAGDHTLVINGMPVTCMEVVDLPASFGCPTHSYNKITAVGPDGKAHVFSVDLSLSQYPDKPSGSSTIGEPIKDPRTEPKKAGATPVEAECRICKHGGFDKKTKKPKDVIAMGAGVAEDVPCILPVATFKMASVTTSESGEVTVQQDVAKCREHAFAYADFLINGAHQTGYKCLISKKVVPRIHHETIKRVHTHGQVRPLDLFTKVYAKARGKFCEALPKMVTATAAAPAAAAATE